MDTKKWEPYFRPLEKKISVRKNIDIKAIQKAFFFAAHAHRDQKRKSDEPYIIHPVAVAQLVAENNGDEESIIAALLHDTVEDTDVELEDVVQEFGKEIATIVEGLTKINKAKYSGSKEDWGVDNFIKFILSSSKDLRIIFIKIFDRIHNLQTIQSFRQEKQERIARDTLEIYIPIANLLGAWKIMVIMEHLILPILFPKEGEEIKKYLEIQKKKSKNLVTACQKIKESHPHATANIYERRGFSLLQYLQEGKKFLPENFFPYGIQIFVPEKKDCYALLESIHSLGIPQFSQIKDFIAAPKHNGYQAFHTALILPKGEYVHIKIMEQNMQQKAEFGFFADMKENTSFAKTIEEILSYKNISGNNRFFFEGIKKNLLQETLQVFGKKGEIISLPKGSTTLDAAILLFPKKFIFLQNIKINGQKSELYSTVKNGDTLHCVFSSKKNITPQWSTIANFIPSKAAITNQLKKIPTTEKEQEGKKILQKTFDTQRKGDIDTLLENKEAFFKFWNVKNISELFISIAEGKNSPYAVLQIYNERFQKKFFKKIFTKIFPSLSKKEHTSSITFFSTKISLRECDKKIREYCNEKNTIIEKLNISNTMKNMHGSATLSNLSLPYLLSSIRSLQTDPEINIRVLPPKIFWVKIFSFVFLPFSIAFGIFSVLFLEYPITNQVSLAYISIFCITFANAIGGILFSQYFPVLRKTTVIFFTLFFLNLFFIIAYYGIFSIKGLDTYNFSLYFPLFAIVLSAFFPLFFNLKNRKKSKELLLSPQTFQQKKKEKIIGYFYRIGAITAFGMTPIVMKYFIPNHNGFTVLSGMFFFGALFLLPLFLINIYKRYKKNKIKQEYKNLFSKFFWIAILFNAAHLLFYVFAAQQTSASNAIIFLNFAPVFALLFAILFHRSAVTYLQKKSNIIQMIFIFIIGIIGTSLLVFSKGSSEHSLLQSIGGDSLAFLSMLFDVISTIGLILYAKSTNSFKGLDYISHKSIILGVMLSPFFIYAFTHYNFSLQDILALCFLGFFDVFLGSWFAYEAYKRIDGFINYLLFNAATLITLSLEVVYFQLPLSTSFILGAAFILGSSVGAEYINTKCEKENIKSEKITS